MRLGTSLAEYDRGDFDGDGDLDADDIDLLYQGIALGVFDDFMVDLNGDGVRDAADMDVMIEQILQTLYGDATLDGNVDGEDYVAWLNGFQSGGSGWAMGDFNGDGVVDGQDFLEWNANKFTGDGQVNNTVLEYIFGYTGRLLDDATGLQNNLNRWYDATVGRWISEDPIGFAAGDANVYRYVENSPTNTTDPSGLIGSDFHADLIYGLGPDMDDKKGEDRNKKKTERDKLLADADRLGVGDEVRDLLETVDSIKGRGIWEGSRLKELLFGPDENPYGISGKCGIWTRKTIDATKGSDADQSDRIELDAVNIRQNRDPGHIENQNALRIGLKEDDGSMTIYYIDDAGVGGRDRVFTDDQRRQWEGNDEGHLTFVTAGDWVFDNE